MPVRAEAGLGTPPLRRLATPVGVEDKRGFVHFNLASISHHGINFRISADCEVKLGLARRAAVFAFRTTTLFDTRCFSEPQQHGWATYMVVYELGSSLRFLPPVVTGTVVRFKPAKPMFFLRWVSFKAAIRRAILRQFRFECGGNFRPRR